jgi:hypothetical protein
MELINQKKSNELYNQEKYLLPLEQIIENFRSRFIFNNPTFAEVGIWDQQKC